MRFRVGYIISALLFAVSFGFSVHAQISPGVLSKVHSQLEGLSNCTKCHELGEKVSSAKCLACHTELKARIDQNKGYHVSAEVKGKQCANCHNDHHGFKLTGAHTKKKCEDCHKSAFIKDTKIKAKKFTYLGLKTECLTCHDDYHQKTLSASCADCHNDE